MDELNKLFKKPDTFKENLEELWFDISYYYPHEIRDFWWNLKAFFRNLGKYKSILWRDHDFDFGYLEEIILTKLEYMAKYFRTARIVVGEERYYEQINWALKIGKIAFDREDFGEGIYFFPGYVNLKTIKRFMPNFNEHDRLETDPKFREIIKDTLRKRKARVLFYRILRDYSENWWD